MKAIETKEYYSVDKSGWPEGEWMNEPDKKQWTDQETGYPCLIVRNDMGALCGYVGVSENHQLYEKCYNEVGEIDVHGGLTFSNHCAPNSIEERDICHTGDGHPWWFGFDCAHGGDCIPTMLVFLPLVLSPGGTHYKNIQYVESECASLATQLKQYEQA